MALNITMHGKIGGDIIDLHPKTDVSQVEGLNSATTVSTEFLNKVSTSSPLAKIKKISGKSVAVNQLTPELTSSNVTIEAGATASITNGVLTMTAPISTGIIFNNTEGTFVVGHVFYLSVDAYASTTGAYRIGGYSDSGIQYEHTVTSSELNTWVSSSSIQTATSNTNGLMINSGSEDFGECKYRNNMLLDLTLIFGTGNEPTTVDNLKSAWLTKFGYPLPTYIPYNSGSIVDCDIKGIGATGRNLVNPTMATTTKNGVTCTNNGDGTYTLNGTSTAATSFDFVENGAIVLPSGSYQIIGYPDGNANGYMRAYIKDYGELLKGQTATLTGSHSVDRVAVIIVSGKTFNNVIIKPMLTADLTATYATFEPYSPYYRSFPIILRSAGNVKDTVEDCGSGYKVTRRVGTVDLGSLTWSYATITTLQFNAHITNKKVGVANNIITAKYGTSVASTIAQIGDKNIRGNNDDRVVIIDSAYSDASTFKTAMNGVMLNYELATPVTEYHSYNLTYPVTVNGTEYFDSPISVPCEIEYGVDALTDIAQALTVSPTKWEEDIDEIKDFVGYNDDEIYGVEVDMENKIFTRLGKAVFMEHGKDFDEIAPWKRRRCNVADNGTVNAYYGDSGYKEDGSNGQVMVEQPAFWYKVVPLKLDPITNGRGFHLRKARYYISEYPRSGFKLHPAFIQNGVQKSKIYLSAYEGSTYDVSASAYNTTDAQTVDWTNDKLASIASAKPTSGLSQSSATRAGFRTIASKRGSGWSQQTVQSFAASQILFLVEYASFNIQEKIGIGVTNKTDDGSTNMAEITGATTSLGNKSGAVTNTNGWNVVSYRGEENPFGNIYKFLDGVNINNGASFGSGSTGTIYVADNSFADNKGDGTYHEVGFSSVYMEWSYISAFGYAEDDDWMFFPTEGTGNSSLPVGDCGACQNTGWRIVRVGALWHYSLTAGLFSWYATYDSGVRIRGLGGRLLYIPQ